MKTILTYHLCERSTDLTSDPEIKRILMMNRVATDHFHGPPRRYSFIRLTDQDTGDVAMYKVLSVVENMNVSANKGRVDPDFPQGWSEGFDIYVVKTSDKELFY